MNFVLDRAGTDLAHSSGSSPDGTSSPVSGRAFRDPCGACATREICLIGGLPQAADNLGPLVRERSFHQGEMLSNEGELSTHFRIVKVGMLFLCRRSAQGETRPVALSERGSAYGICSYLTQPNQVSVVAASSGRCCEIPTARIEALALADKAFRDRLGTFLVDAVSRLAQWAQAIGSRGVLAQVANVLRLLAAGQRSSSIVIPSHTALAEMLGTTRESVARALASLESAGCLTRTGLRRCEIHPQPLSEWQDGTGKPCSSTPPVRTGE